VAARSADIPGRRSVSVAGHGLGSSFGSSQAPSAGAQEEGGLIQSTPTRRPRRALIITRRWLPIGDKNASAGFRVVLPEVLVGYAPDGIGPARLVQWARSVMENLVTRLLVAIAVAAAVLFAAGCMAGTAHLAASPAPLPPDPHTASALLKIATAFNHDYNTGDYGPVYAPVGRTQPGDHHPGGLHQAA
jgi:hypothetical protein